ncbi:MAG: bifunctional diaminohydroxyphosphoribosylaminopyrimidine deaminase/5-amino-6-(5-phosphoribosylamino)uracil reductase RibD [Epsilonproteobacteria bacterium]|nr:bifunctional diaminohydroxyphosphoribosylaminopyrimidine deaminase/5-amino-6-(5-phosphoribosylamino)uracil reductase RibD [Campylobacterota bacterium]
MTHKDECWMRVALRQAAKAIGSTSPNPAVGAVIVKNNHLIAAGYHHKAGEAHAEIEALKAAGIDADGAEMYVTLEPCDHYGRTPPCTSAIINSGIKTVVIATEDPNSAASGGIKRLRQSGIAVRIGICRQAARKINEVFITNITKKRPFVVMKAAVTLDGQIAASAGDSGWISGHISRRYSKRLRARYDSILIGAKTAEIDNPVLAPYKKTEKFYRIILDGRLSLNYPNLLSQPDNLIIFCSNEIDDAKHKSIDKKIIIKKVDSSKGMLDIKQVLSAIFKMGIMSVFVEGGSRIHRSFLEKQLYDKAFIFIAPKFMGGSGVPLFQGKGADFMKNTVTLKKTECRKIGKDIVMSGYFDV